LKTITLAYKKESLLHGPDHFLECSLCGENDRDELIVEDMGMSVGMCGDEYSFCKKCWGSKDLGKQILSLLGYQALKLLDENLELREIEI